MFHTSVFESRSNDMNFIVVLSFISLQCFNVNIVGGGNISEKSRCEFLLDLAVDFKVY